MKCDMWATGSNGKLRWFVKPSSRWTYVDIVSTTSPTIRSAKAKLTTRQLNVFRSSSFGPLYTAQQIRKFVGTVKKNRTMAMVAVKNDSDIGGGTAEQSFSKSDMASAEYASISFWQITDVLSKCNLRSQRQGGCVAQFETKLLDYIGGIPYQFGLVRCNFESH